MNGDTQKLDDQAKLDPCELRIQGEVEEFLRDLTLEYPFPEIFEILKRYEVKDRLGPNVTPLHQKKHSAEALKEIQGRVSGFQNDLRKTFGKNYVDFINETFRYYTSTTIEDI